MDIICNQGNLTFGSLTSLRAAVGAGGVVDASVKKEGDRATPAGRFQLREVFYRADRIAEITTALPLRELKPDDGWCDDPTDPNYNKFVKLPYEASHEKLWREDEIYDIVVPLGYNDEPPVPGKGSAIFIHVARPALTPTDGCIALAKDDLLKLIVKVPETVFITIQ